MHSIKSSKRWLLLSNKPLWGVDTRMTCVNTWIIAQLIMCSLTIFGVNHFFITLVSSPAHMLKQPIFIFHCFSKWLIFLFIQLFAFIQDLPSFIYLGHVYILFGKVLELHFLFFCKAVESTLFVGQKADGGDDAEEERDPGEHCLHPIIPWAKVKIANVQGILSLYKWCLTHKDFQLNKVDSQICQIRLGGLSVPS